MSEDLKIECKWLSRESGSPLNRAFYADIGLAIGNEWFTQLEDIEANTVRNHVRACGHQFALWIATNWWRLRWEPETRTSRLDADWKIAHSLASAGGGYVWPNIFFASDGESLAVASVPRLKGSIIEPIRYLSRVLARITADEFEQKVDVFMEGMLSRMCSVEAVDDTLAKLWTEVKAERFNTEATRWRKLEAICGYDPGYAPENMIETLVEDKFNLGSVGIEEAAAEGRHSTSDVLKNILKLASEKNASKDGGFRAKIPKLSGKQQYDPGSRPWQRAAKLAKQARKEWGFAKEPISNKQLAELLSISQAALAKRSKTVLPMSIALREEEDSKHHDFYFNSSWETSRRFATSRLLGHCLYQAGGEGGRLVAATSAKTSSQQFQRAFAQEFLCPYDALLNKIQTTQPEADDIEEAADFFKVSPLVVKTTLVNKGELDREVLDWDW